MFNVTTVLPHNLLQTNPCIHHNFSTQVSRKRVTQLHFVGPELRYIFWPSLKHFSFKNPHKKKSHWLISGLRGGHNLPPSWHSGNWCDIRGRSEWRILWSDWQEIPNSAEALLVDLLGLRVKALQTASMFAGVRTLAGHGSFFSNTDPLVSNYWQSL